MDYPLFEVPKLGGGMLVAIVAIIHVAIAHLAVGAGCYIAIAHTWAIRHNDTLLLDFLKHYGRFLILLSFVTGALTGVGIWVTISLVSPAATSALIHLFVWAWAIEWDFFLIEIVSGYVYYYGWNRLTPKRHAAVAWIYFVAAWMSLFVINGIIAFMLTPGAWQPPSPNATTSPQQAFWVALLNPSFWPSLFLRTVSALAFAGISVAVVANCIRGYSRDQRQHITRIGSYLLTSLGLMAPLAVWYFAVLPEESRRFAMGGSIAMTLFLAFGIVSSLYIGGYTYLGLIRPKCEIDLPTSLLLMAVAVVATGSMEFVREGVRKPYLIYGYLYSNGIPATPEATEQINRQGILAHARFAYPPGMTRQELHRLPLHQLGQYVYNAECRICHSPGGTNAIEPLINNAPRELVAQITSQLHQLKRYMPPFLGTPLEKRALVEYQLHLANSGGYLPPATSPNPPADSRAAETREISP